MNLTHSTRAMQAIRERPSKLGATIQRTLIGIPVAIGGGAAAAFLKWPWYVCVPVVLFGLAVAAPGCVTAALKLVVGAMKDVLATVKPQTPS